jgi:AcrR family transcriptional regulator
MQSNPLEFLAGGGSALAEPETARLPLSNPNAEIAASLPGVIERSGSDVRERLLQVSAEYFARDGFNRTSVREICRAARANVASIRYYFGSKLGLYRELLMGSVRTAIEMHPMPVFDAREDAVAGIRRWVIHMINLKLRDGFQEALMCRLIEHEMNDPSPALDEVVDLLFAPFHVEMEKSIAQLFDYELTDAQLRHLSLQLTTICFQYAQRRNVLHRMKFNLPATAEEFENLVDYVTKFFIGGAKAVA